MQPVTLSLLEYDALNVALKQDRGPRQLICKEPWCGPCIVVEWQLDSE